MSAAEFDKQRLEELLLISANESLPEAERAELNAILRSSAAARMFAVRTLTFDSLLTESLKAIEVTERHTAEFRADRGAPLEVDFKPRTRTRTWLARAAAWVGGFHLIGHSAEAASTTAAAKGSSVLTQSAIALLMKKTVTSITAAILVLGGAGIYVIHRGNESSRARLASMEAEIQSLGDQLGIESTGLANRRPGTTGSQRAVGITRVIAIYDGDNVINPEEGEILQRFKEQLAAMDVVSLETLLLDAEKISNPINDSVAELIMAELIRKSPADATRISSELIGRGSEFQFSLSSAAANAFAAWLAEDPAAADAWYVATAAADGLGGKSIAPNGLEHLAVDRSFARLRFAAQVAANPAEAAAMIATMLPADVTTALQTVTDPDALRQILPALGPEQKGPAAEGAIKAMAAKDLDAAFTWANSLGMEDRERDTLLASGIEAAVADGKLDLAGAAERSKDLKLDAQRRSGLQVAVAVSSTFKEERVADWDRVADRTDWLRKEAPPELANKMVGDFIGRVAYNSRNPDQSFKAYEEEVARLGGPNPELTIAYTFWLGTTGSNRLTDQAMKYLQDLPASPKRDEAIRNLENNR